MPMIARYNSPPNRRAAADCQRQPRQPKRRLRAIRGGFCSKVMRDGGNIVHQVKVGKSLYALAAPQNFQLVIPKRFSAEESARRRSSRRFRQHRTAEEQIPRTLSALRACNRLGMTNVNSRGRYGLIVCTLP